MGKVKGPISQFLSESRDLIDNSGSDPGIMTKLAGFGFTEAKVAALKALLQECDTLQSVQMKEYGDQVAATSELNTLWNQADQTYMNTLKVARVALRGTTRPGKEILLYGPRLRSFTGWVEQAKRFYDNLLRDNELMNKMTEYGYTPEKLQQEAALMEQVYQKHLQQVKEMGEAQEATKTRDQKLDELAVSISDFRAIVKVALSDSPQQLEKLGILVRSGPASRKQAPPDPGDTEE